MKKILILGSLLLAGCSMFSQQEYEVAVLNNTDKPVLIKTFCDSDMYPFYIQKNVIEPHKVKFMYTNSDVFYIYTDIKVYSSTSYGQELVDCMKMYFENSSYEDRQLEINPDCFYLDETKIEPMDWN